METVALYPRANLALGSIEQRWDAMHALSRVLMGMPSAVQLLANAIDECAFEQWPNPPTVQRSWLAHGAKVGRLASVGFAVRPTETEVQPPFGRDDVQSWGVRLGDGRWFAGAVLRRWPREVAPGWLGHALAACAYPVTAAIHVVPEETAAVARFLKNQVDWQAAGKPDAASALGQRDAGETRKRLVARLDRPVRVAIVFGVYASDRAELVRRVSGVCDELHLALGDAFPTRGEHDWAFEACRPGGRMPLVGAYRLMDCASVASCGIFQPTTVAHVDGAPIGTSEHMLVKLDPFDESLPAFSGLLTGSVGSGKSYFLKLLLRRLLGVEIRIVEHSDPPEYHGVPGLQVLNIAGLSEDEQAARLGAYIDELWGLARRDPRPRLLVLDELWELLKRPQLREMVETIARRGRKYGLALWIATQQAEELLRDAKAVFDNAKVRIYLQQENRDLEGLFHAAGLPDPARLLLRGAARGQALMDVMGTLVWVDVQATPSEHRLISTDPREVWHGRARTWTPDRQEDNLARRTADRSSRDGRAVAP